MGVKHFDEPYDHGYWKDGIDLSKWGYGCQRGINYKDLGPVTDGQAGAVRKIGSGTRKKHQKSTSDQVAGK